MDNTDLEILKNALKWHGNGESTYLITVIKTWGTAPRPVGSIMAISDKGNWAGSISGGCIEEDLFEKIRNPSFLNNCPQILGFGGESERQQRYKIPCGGQIELLFEHLIDFSNLKIIAAAIEDGQQIVRNVNMQTGNASLQIQNTDYRLHYDRKTLRRCFGPRWRLLIIGAGDLSRYVARMAIPLGYQVTVCDPREEYASSWNIPNTIFEKKMPDDVVIDMNIDSRCAILTLTHDPKLDDMALLDALGTNAFYIGSLGSKKTNAKRRERLKLLGVSESNLKKLKGPVGLSINSRTPPEIAISILAEMISTLNKSIY